MKIEGMEFTPRFGNESHIRILKMAQDLDKLRKSPAAKRQTRATLKQIEEKSEHLKRSIRYDNETNTKKTA